MGRRFPAAPTWCRGLPQAAQGWRSFVSSWGLADAFLQASAQMRITLRCVRVRPPRSHTQEWRLYLVMEYCDGGCLRDMITRRVLLLDHGTPDMVRAKKPPGRKPNAHALLRLLASQEEGAAGGPASRRSARRSGRGRERVLVRLAAVGVAAGVHPGDCLPDCAGAHAPAQQAHHPRRPQGEGAPCSQLLLVCPDAQAEARASPQERLRPVSALAPVALTLILVTLLVHCARLRPSNALLKTNAGALSSRLSSSPRALPAT